MLAMNWFLLILTSIKNFHNDKSPGITTGIAIPIENSGSNSGCSCNGVVETLRKAKISKATTCFSPPILHSSFKSSFWNKQGGLKQDMVFFYYIKRGISSVLYSKHFPMCMDVRVIMALGWSLQETIPIWHGITLKNRNQCKETLSLIG